VTDLVDVEVRWEGDDEDWDNDPEFAFVPPSRWQRFKTWLSRLTG